jgi:hypothetical protein
VTELVGLFSPRRARYDVRVTDGGVREVPSDGYSELSLPPLRVVEEEGSQTITDLRVDVGGVQSFLAEGSVNVPPIETDLELATSAESDLWLIGTLNNGPIPLEDAVLLIGRTSFRLGDLEAGQAITVNTKSGPSLLPPSDVAEQILGTTSYYNDAELYRRYEFLQTLFPYYGPGLRAGVYLVGWSDEPPLDIEIVGRQSSLEGTTLYIFKLSAELPADTDLIVIPPELIAREVEASGGYGTAEPQYIFIPNGDSIVFRFTIWSDFMVTRVDEMHVNLLPMEYGPSPLPEISLWNWTTEEWDPQEVLDWGEFAIPRPSQYVHLDGIVHMQLGTPETGYVEMRDVTITIEGRRE